MRKLYSSKGCFQLLCVGRSAVSVCSCARAINPTPHDGPTVIAILKNQNNITKVMSIDFALIFIILNEKCHEWTP